MGRNSEFTLTENEVCEIEELRATAREARDIALLKRTRAILLIGRDGFTRQDAAIACEAGLRTVFTWQREFRKSGVAGLLTGEHPGRPPNLTDADLKTLGDIIEKGPDTAGYDTGRWTAALVAEVIFTRFRVRYATGHVRRLLHKLGFSVQYPKKTGKGRPHRTSPVA